ncbi:hypothetical protein [Nonomuraea dietziae]|uniref:hypothetical protein n=1 Tax=Nonomuraea dietziae TaxID=65515 RepID=UPI0033E694C7
MRIKNVSRQTVYSVRLTAKLKVNGRSVGSCSDWVGTMRAGKVRVASCTVRTGRLAGMWRDRYDYGRWYVRAHTSVRYLYYR